jgi:hypothetical protein
MNYRLLFLFLVFTSVEFLLFWGIAGLLPPFLTQYQFFMIIVAIDIFATEWVFPGAFKGLYRAIMNKNSNDN